MFGMLGMMGSVSDAGGAVTQGKTIFSTRSYGLGLRPSARAGAPGASFFADTTSTALVSFAFGYPGTISDAQVPYIATNTNASDSIMGPYNFTSGLTLYATIPGLSTAPAYNTGTLAVAASDEILWIWQRLAAGTVTVFASVATFAADPGEGHVQILGGGATVFNTASATRYGLFMGPLSTSNLSMIATAEIRVSTASELSRCEIRTTFNPRTTDSTVFVAVNGTVVASATVLAGATPSHVLTPGTALSVGDRISWGCITGAGSGNLNAIASLTLRNATEPKSDVWTAVDSLIWAVASACYAPILTYTSTDATYRAGQVYNSFKLGYAATLAVPQIYVSTNASTVPCTARLLVNGSPSGVSITIPVGSGAGWITGTGSVTVTATDDLVWETLGPVASGGSGTFFAPTLGIQIQYLSG